MPDLGLIGAASGAAASEHPLTSEDILAGDGGQLTRRGRLMYAADFRDGYGGWNPVHNAGGSEPPRSPLSLVDYPRRALRLAVPGPSLGQGNSTDAILRLERPTAADGVCSISFRYALFSELAPTAPSTANAEMPFSMLSFGFDTQAWSNLERQFFSANAIPHVTDVNSDTWSLRGVRATHGGPINRVTVPAGRGATSLLAGFNENKMNWGYMRLTVRYGAGAEYLELQAGGKLVDLRGITSVAEPMQISPTDTSANFRGGFNPFFGIVAKATTEALAVGVYLTDIAITIGDDLA